jgi:tetratricopeptide (TPR) repeat protein
MPIRRPRTPRPGLRHVVFLETMADLAAADPRQRAAHVTFLVLRLVDSWVAFGGAVTDAASRALAETRREIDSLVVDAELRAMLTNITDAVVALPDADPQPALPRIYALGKLLEERALLAEAGDVYRTVSRYADAAANLDLAYESNMRTGSCLRQAGEFEWAEQAYTSAGMLATRDRDRIRVIHARLGRAKVLWARAEFDAAEDAIAELIGESERNASDQLTALLRKELESLRLVAARTAQ